jgi:hypothetical protein
MVAGWSPDFSNHVLLKRILWNEIKKGIRGLSMGYPMCNKKRGELDRETVIENEFSDEENSIGIKNLETVLVRCWYGVGTALVWCLFIGLNFLEELT